MQLNVGAAFSWLESSEITSNYLKLPTNLVRLLITMKTAHESSTRKARFHA
ncbi:MAG TPA: hypothetical protein VM821_07285 [Abditibacteriaceae bacterium]|nr:hypothetical protein [Abditibacteriaceae bacterium]